MPLRDGVPHFVVDQRESDLSKSKTVVRQTYPEAVFYVFWNPTDYDGLILC